MTKKYEELRKMQIFTVGELVDELNKLPRETKLDITDADIGGYDVGSQMHCVIQESGEGIITFGNLEYTAWAARSEGEITDEEFNLLCPR